MNLYAFELKRSAKSLFWWTLILCLLMVVYIGFFPSMKEIAMEKMDALPEEFLKAFGLAGGMDFTEFYSYFGLIIAYLFMAVSAYGAILGVSALSREESEGTIEFLNAQPIKRSKIVWAKFFASLTNLAIVGAAMFATTVAVIAANGPEAMGEADIAVVALTFWLAYLPILSYFGMGFILSTFLSRTARATSLALALFFGTYMLGVMSTLYEEVVWLKWAAPLQWVVPAEILRSELGSGTGSFDFLGAYISVGVLVVAVVATLALYSRKDLQSRA